MLRVLNIISSQGPAFRFNLSSFHSAIQTSNTYHVLLIGAPISDSEYCNQFFSSRKLLVMLMVWPGLKCMICISLLLCQHCTYCFVSFESAHACWSYTISKLRSAISKLGGNLKIGGQFRNRYAILKFSN